MPDLTDLTVDQARQRLKDLGLVVGKITQQSVDGKKDGVIIAQSLPEILKCLKGQQLISL